MPSTSHSSSSSSSSSSSHTVVRTDGGTIEVSGAGGVLDVIDVSAAAGWEVAVEQPDDRRLEAKFTRSGGRTEVVLVLTDTGIQSSTRSVATG